MKKRASKFEPETYLPSKSDPSYRREAARYAVRHICLSPAKQKKRMAEGALLNGQAIIDEAGVREMEADFVDSLTSSIEAGWQSAPIGKGHATFSDEDADYVTQAVRIFRVDALRLSPLDERIVRRQDSSDSRLTGLTRKDQLGAAVCNVIREWRDQAEKGNIEERRQAIEHLGNVAKVLIPEARGKRERTLTVPPFQVVLFYYNQMFDLYHIQNALRTRLGNISEKVKAASENFEMSVEQIRHLWNLDDQDRPKGRPVSIQEMARILTAERFHITQHTVSNIIAS